MSFKDLIGRRIEAIIFARLYKYDQILIILPPGVITLGAAEKPDLALICSPELAKPPDCKVILALGAFDLDGGHGPHTFLLFIHDHNLLFLAL